MTKTLLVELVYRSFVDPGFINEAADLLYQEQETLGDVTFMFENEDLSPWGLPGEPFTIAPQDIIRHASSSPWARVGIDYTRILVATLWVGWLNAICKSHGIGVKHFRNRPTLARNPDIEAKFGLPKALRMTFEPKPLPIELPYEAFWSDPDPSKTLLERLTFSSQPTGAKHAVAAMWIACKKTLTKKGKLFEVHGYPNRISVAYTPKVPKTIWDRILD